MPVQYSLEKPFPLENLSVWAVNIIFDPALPTIPAHSHGTGCYELHFIPSGEGTLEAEGATYPIGPGALYMTGPHVRHAQIPSREKPMQEYCVYLQVEQRGKRPSPLTRLFCATPFWFGKDDGEVEAIFRQVFQELQQKQTGYDLQVQLLLGQLIVKLARCYQASSQEPVPAPAPRSENHATFIIEECFLYEYKTLTLQSLAQRLQFSPRQTQRLLKSYYGSTFQQKKQEARLSAALELLRNSDRPIGEIAEDLGFSSPEHFANAFKKVYGTSPSQYRKERF